MQPRPEFFMKNVAIRKLLCYRKSSLDANKRCVVNPGGPSRRLIRTPLSPISSMIHSFNVATAIDNPTHAREQPTVLLAEPCDDVFTRVATYITEMSISVVRARSAGEAYSLTASQQPILVVANVDLPDQNGWFLARQLQFRQPTIHLWLYQADFNEFEIGMASCLQVRELLEYGKDLRSLSAQLQALLDDTLSLDRGGNRVSKAV